MSGLFIAALTGRSGAGKSFASAHLAAGGVPVVDGDAVAREVVRPGSECLRRLAEEFGDGILKEDGSLDRRRLAALSFSDAKKKAALDSIMHPYIVRRMLERFDGIAAAGYRYCLVEAAALMESGLYKSCDRVILIVSDREREIGRIMRRDQMTKEEAERRIGMQMSDDSVRAVADCVIENNGTADEFREKLDRLAEQLAAWFQ